MVGAPENHTVPRALKGDSQLPRRVAGLHFAFEQQCLADEIAHELIGRLLIEQARIAQLLYHAEIHQRNVVREAQGLDLIVGDEQHRDVQPLLQELDLDAHLLAELGVQVAEGLIQQQHPRFVH